MKVLLQLHFDFQGPFGTQMSEQLQALAESINQEPGFIWKVWTENEAAAEAGGVYLFEDEAAARAYLEKHSQRLQAFGVKEVVHKLFYVNEALTAVNHGKLD